MKALLQAAMWKATKKRSRRGSIHPPHISLQRVLKQDLALDAFRTVQVCAVPRMLPEQIPAVRARESGVVCGRDWWMLLCFSSFLIFL